MAESDRRDHLRLHRDLKWWYWLVTALLLGLGLSGWAMGVGLAVVATAVQVPHFLLREGRIGALSVQVRLLYLAVLLLGFWEPVRFVHWLQLAGVWANVLFGYCLAARMLSLLPWNRRVPLTRELVEWTFLSPPRAGSIVDRARAAPVLRGPAPREQGGHARGSLRA